MIITLPDGKELSLKWAGRVGEFEIKLPNRNNPTLVNDAGLLYYFETFASPFRKADPHAKHRCVRDYPWVCPYMQQGGHAPCVSKKASDKKHLATTEVTNWERKQGFRPDDAPKLDKKKWNVVGTQLTLFEAGYWEHVETGEQRWTNEPRPYAVTDLVCKEFAVASMEYQKRHWGWDGLKWRIQPVKEDLAWINDQQVKYSGRFSACVFDVWD